MLLAACAVTVAMLVGPYMLGISCACYFYGDAAFPCLILMWNSSLFLVNNSLPPGFAACSHMMVAFILS